MEKLRNLFYLLFIIVGGFRHYSSEYHLVSKVLSKHFDESIYQLFQVIDLSLFALAAVAVLWPGLKIVDLIFGIILIAVDVFLQNFIRFQSAIIFIHFIPFYYFFLRTYRNPEFIRETAIYVIATGFILSAIAKINSGWLDTDVLVIKYYMIQFGIGYHMNEPIAEFLNNWPLAFFKGLDYAAILFEISFFVLFIRKKALPTLLGAACVFHLLVSLFLNINIFYPYVLVYCTFLVPVRIEKSARTGKMSDIVKFILLLIVIVSGWYYGTNLIMGIVSTSVYLHFERVITISLIILYMLLFWNNTGLGKKILWVENILK